MTLEHILAQHHGWNLCLLDQNQSLGNHLLLFPSPMEALELKHISIPRKLQYLSPFNHNLKPIINVQISYPKGKQKTNLTVLTNVNPQKKMIIPNLIQKASPPSLHQKKHRENTNEKSPRRMATNIRAMQKFHSQSSASSSSSSSSSSS
jgi:hypothetical protein